MLLSVPEISSRIYHLPCFGRLACCPTSMLSAFVLFSFLLCANSSSGSLACHLASTINLCCFTSICFLRVRCWEFGSLCHPHSLGHIQCSTPTPAVSARLQFGVYVFQFCWGVTGLFSLGGWVRELCVVCDAHLFLLQLHTGSFGVAGGEKWLCLFFSSVAWHREAFHRLGVQNVTEFDSDWCCVFCVLGREKKERKENRNSQRLYSQSQAYLAGCAVWDFPGC
jgi:hypothetical protein